MTKKKSKLDDIVTEISVEINISEKDVKNALKWKKTSEYCAERLGITEEEFDKIKKEVYAEGREKRKEERNIKD